MNERQPLPDKSKHPIANRLKVLQSYGQMRLTLAAQPTSTDRPFRAAIRDIYREVINVPAIGVEYVSDDETYDYDHPTGIAGVHEQQLPVPEYMKRRSVQIALGVLGVAGTIGAGAIAIEVVPTAFRAATEWVADTANSNQQGPATNVPSPAEYTSLLQNIATGQ
jgi:hypothetical protein